MDRQPDKQTDRRQKPCHDISSAGFHPVELKTERGHHVMAQYTYLQALSTATSLLSREDNSSTLRVLDSMFFLLSKIFPFLLHISSIASATLNLSAAKLMLSN